MQRNQKKKIFVSVVFMLANTILAIIASFCSTQKEWYYKVILVITLFFPILFIAFFVMKINRRGSWAVSMPLRIEPQESVVSRQEKALRN